MGRHAASTAVDEPTRSTKSLAVPVTDPILLDRVAAQLDEARAAKARAKGTRTPRPEAWTPPRSAPAVHEQHASAPAVAQHLHLRTPPVVAPVQLPRPRAAVARPVELSFTDGPLDVVPRLVAVPLTVTPRTPFGSPARSTDDVDAAPAGARRTAVVTACALALLGAVSTAAIVLPAPAEAVGDRSHPASSGSSATAGARHGAPAVHDLGERLGVHRSHWRFLGRDFSMPTPLTRADGTVRPSAAEEAASTTPSRPVPSTRTESPTTGASPAPEPSASSASKRTASRPKPKREPDPERRTTPRPATAGDSPASPGSFVVGSTKPSSRNTGAGIVRPYPTKVINGDVTLTGGQSLKDTIVHGRVSVKGTGNVVENCVITGPLDHAYTNGTWLVNTSSATDAVVRFNTIRAAHTSPYVNGIGLRNVTAERNDISRVIDGFDIDTGASSTDAHTTIRANFVHDLQFYGRDPQHGVTPLPSWYRGPWAGVPWSHNDGIQITSGTGVTVEGNTIDASWSRDIGTLPLPTYVNELSSMMITAPRGAITGLVVRDNWFDGGAYNINAGGARGSGAFTGNRFGRNIHGSGDALYTLVFDSKFDAATSDNTFEDSGAAVTVRRNY